MTDSDSVYSLFDIRDKVAVVPGGSGALGGAIARGLGRAGARVAIMGRRREACERVAAELVALGAEAFAAPCDVLDREALDERGGEHRGAAWASGYPGERRRRK